VTPNLRREFVATQQAGVYMWPYTPEGKRPHWNVWDMTPERRRRVELEPWAKGVLFRRDSANKDAKGTIEDTA